MIKLTFDTHKFVTELKQAGLSQEQVEVITRLHQQATNATIEYVKHVTDGIDYRIGAETGRYLLINNKVSHKIN